MFALCLAEELINVTINMIKISLCSLLLLAFISQCLQNMELLWEKVQICTIKEIRNLQLLLQIASHFLNKISMETSKMIYKFKIVINSRPKGKVYSASYFLCKLNKRLTWVVFRLFLPRAKLQCLVTVKSGVLVNQLGWRKNRLTTLKGHFRAHNNCHQTFLLEWVQGSSFKCCMLIN